MIKIFEIKSARKRRSSLLRATNKSKSPEGRYAQAYNRCLYTIRTSRNPLTRMKAKSDAEYFKRKLSKYR